MHCSQVYVPVIDFELFSTMSLPKPLLLSILFLLPAVYILPACEGVPEEGEQLLSDPGVVSFSFRYQFEEDLPGTLDLIREMGINNIEFSNLFGLSAAELRRELDARDMVCTSYGVGYRRLMEETEEIIEEAQTLGAEFVRVGSIPYDRSGPFTIEDARRAVDDFNRIGRVLREAGLHFLYHNHGFEFRPYGDGTLYDYIVQNTDPEYVNFEMDLGWVIHPGHDPVELLQRYPDRFYATHLKDFRPEIEHNYSGTAPVEMNAPLGEGLIDFGAFLHAAQESSIRYHYIEYEALDVVEVMPGNIAYITGLRK